MQLDLRVGEVVAAHAPDWSHKLLEFTVDLGSEYGERTILSGVKEWYRPEDFLGNKYIIVANLEEKKMGEGVSQGMMLMADAEDAEAGEPVLIQVPADVPVGSVVR
jgi:methionyl-tRNA synthetase